MPNDSFSGYILGARLTQHTHNRFYEAQSIHSPTTNALIKIFSVRRFSDEESSRFLHEAQLLSTLRHPAILPLYAAGIKGRLPYIVMPYVRSGSLRDYITRSPLPTQTALSILVQLGQALTYAHEYQIVHGDIKPENILFLSSDRVCLTDFQFSTLAELAHSTFTPTPEQYPYWAPEQFSGPPTAASDQYALACVAYELLIGHLPTEQKVASASSALVEHKQRVILKALAEDPERRYASVAQFIQALQNAFALEHKHAHEKKRQLAGGNSFLQQPGRVLTSKLFTGNAARVGSVLLLGVCILLLAHTFFNTSNFSMTNISKGPYVPPKSSITGSLNASPPLIDLTTEGTTDWAIWGYQAANSTVHKHSGQAKIGPLTYINLNPQAFIVYGGSQTQYSWTDGAPVTTTPYIGQSGVEIVGNRGCGFRFSVPASTSPHVLRIYVGVDDGQGELVATLSDGTSYHAATFSSVTTVQGDFYELHYQADSNNQTLTIRYTVSDDTTPHSIMLQAATLQ